MRPPAPTFPRATKAVLSLPSLDTGLPRAGTMARGQITRHLLCRTCLCQRQGSPAQLETCHRLPDREARVREFFLHPATRLPDRRFLLAGAGWTVDDMPPNVTVPALNLKANETNGKLTVTAADKAAPGEYKPILQGVGKGITVAAPLTLTIQPK